MLNKPRLMPEKVFTEKFQKRFWAKVDRSGAPSECWPWRGHSSHLGYGIVSITGSSTGTVKKYLAHRIALVLSSSSDSSELLALHNCDNPACCNPEHLYWGTYSDNRVDCVARERSNIPTGESAVFAKLDDTKVAQILQLSTEGVTQRQIAKQFSVSQSAISAIVSGVRWTHVPRPGPHKPPRTEKA